MTDPRMYPSGSQSIGPGDVETSPTATDLVETFDAVNTNDRKAISLANVFAKINAACDLTAITASAAQISALAGAGIVALLNAGLGGSHSVVKTETGAHTVIAAHATKARACLVVVVVDEVFADVGGAQTIIEVGEDDTIDKCFDHTKLVDAALGSVWVFAFTNTAAKKVIITSTARTVTGTGGVTVTALAIPTT